MKKLLLLSILSISLFSQENIIINGNLAIEKTQEYYQEEENLLEEAPKIKETKNQKNKIDINGNVDVNKDNRTLDSVNINIGSKF